MTHRKPIRATAAAVCTVLLGAGLVLAAGNDPPEPNGGHRTATTVLNGGNAIAGVSADSKSGLRVSLGTGASTNGASIGRTSGTKPGPGPDDPFARLVASLAQKACNANGDTILWEMQAGATNGFMCVASPGTPPRSDRSASLADFALAAEASLPWPGVAINANPNDLATVAVPTYYWVNGYDGSSRSVEIGASVQEGDRCTPTFETSADGTEAQTGRDCVPNMVDYNVVVTARPTSYTWHFGDENQTSGKDGQRSVVTRSGPEGLGTPFQAPNWSSPIMHLFNVSSFQHEAEGGYQITLTIAYGVAWEANAPATGEHQSGSLGSVGQTVARPQRVREIQVLRGASVVHCQNEGRC